MNARTASGFAMMALSVTSTRRHDAGMPWRSTTASTDSARSSCMNCTAEKFTDTPRNVELGWAPR